ncbi:hypothetical protein P7K49_019136 [Saguinus oedipus]|uniref:WW domain-containing protein n=1 Tax=Saguinus oedipus TaxID=9490 RepID=A0ABQ9UXD9_SAGOE|nr:hypothetical protein P7K49_019136 [Saguinus oedipus]
MRRGGDGGGTLPGQLGGRRPRGRGARGGRAGPGRGGAGRAGVGRGAPGPRGALRPRLLGAPFAFFASWFPPPAAAAAAAGEGDKVADLNLEWICSLPRSWITRGGRVFFINEEAKSTTWLHPVTGEAVQRFAC